MSINKAQAAALAEQFIDTLGTDDKEGLQPRETLRELFVLSGEFVEDAQNNLNESNSNASGSLSNSLLLSDPRESNGAVSVDVLMNYYGQFINSGVKGTKSGQGKYQFKSEFPSIKMVQALLKSIKTSKKKVTNVNRSRSIFKNEVKNAKISEISRAYGAARNIKMYGIKPTGFIDKAVQTTSDKISERLGKAFKIDIINSI